MEAIGELNYHEAETFEYSDEIASEQVKKKLQDIKDALCFLFDHSGYIYSYVHSKSKRRCHLYHMQHVAGNVQE